MLGCHVFTDSVNQSWNRGGRSLRGHLAYGQTGGQPRGQPVCGNRTAHRLPTGLTPLALRNRSPREQQDLFILCHCDDN
jgi:hypothetical protein